MTAIRFTLHGRIDLDITFEGLTMRTPVYIKLDASEPLLLSEGVCRQLRILSYHPRVSGHRDRQGVRVRSPSNVEKTEDIQKHGEQSQSSSEEGEERSQFSQGNDQVVPHRNRDGETVPSQQSGGKELGIEGGVEDGLPTQSQGQDIGAATMPEPKVLEKSQRHDEKQE